MGWVGERKEWAARAYLQGRDTGTLHTSVHRHVCSSVRLLKRRVFLLFVVLLLRVGYLGKICWCFLSDVEAKRGMVGG